MSAVKQIVLEKDKDGGLTGMTIFYWGDQIPSIILYNPPAILDLKIEELIKKKRVVKKKRHHATTRR